MEYGKPCEEVKEIAYAYPGSETAKAFGYADSGCYVLRGGVYGGAMKDIMGSPDFYVVMERAIAVPCMWSEFSFIPDTIMMKERMVWDTSETTRLS